MKVLNEIIDATDTVDVSSDVHEPILAETNETILKSENTKTSAKKKSELSAEDKEILKELKEKRSIKRRDIINRIMCIVLSFCCVYMMFLIYGVFNTKYIYDDKGNVVPQLMTIDKLRDLDEFNNIAAQYRQSRMLYEKVLELDYRVAAGLEDPLAVAPEYDMLLDTVEELIIEIQAMSVSSKYTQLHNMISVWVKTDVAVYCQSMSQAISQNNTESASKAMEYKNIMYNDFSIITTNIITLGDGVYGAEISDIMKWSPEKYVRENLGAV